MIDNQQGKRGSKVQVKRPSQKKVVEDAMNDGVEQIGAELAANAAQSQSANMQNPDVQTNEVKEGTQASWDRAVEIVQKIRPVPWPIWIITRSVFGFDNKLGDPHHVMFSRFDYMLSRALDDADICNASSEADEAEREEARKIANSIPVEYIVATLGSDVAAALCFVHAVSRKVGSKLPARIRNPIIDEALLRSQIGYHIGKGSPIFGAGRGMLAGFAARSGLAIQFAFGATADAEKALESLASGVDFHQVGLAVYGCDPLQVSAMALVAGGCGRDAAYGTAAYSVTSQHVAAQTAYQWLAAFSVAESLRVGRGEQIQEAHWLSLGVMNYSRDEICEASKRLVRYGHTWQWLLNPP